MNKRKNRQRIVFLGDLLRFQIDGTEILYGQSENINWLASLVSTLPAWSECRWVVIDGPAQIKRALAGSGRPNQKLLEDYQADPAMAWARRYNADEPEALGSLLDGIGDEDLVVGFEMPPLQKRVLMARNIRYLNLLIHPLRFLKDLVFGATTNDARIHQLLTACSLGDATVQPEVRRYRALLAKKHPPALAFPSHLPILVGQTQQDSALIQDANFARWEDYEAQLAHELQGFPELVFSEHPMQGPARTTLAFLRHRLGKTLIATNAIGYGFAFATPGPPLVLTLSSSLGVEAASAGVNAKFLLGDPRDRFYVKGVDCGAMQAVGHPVLQDDFWNSVLGDSINAQAPDTPQAQFSLGADFIRSTTEAWSFKALQNGLSDLKSRKSIYASAELDESRLRSLVRSMGGQNSGSWPTATDAVDLQYVTPIDLGETRSIEFGKGAGVTCLGEGFHPAEGWGIWGSAYKLEVLIPISDAARAAQASLHIELPVYLEASMLRHCPAVRVTAPGAPPALLFFRPSTGGTAQVRLSCPANAPVLKIWIEISRVGIPALEGMDDSRTLALALTNIQVRCESQAAPVEESAAEAVVDIGQGQLHG